MAKYINADALLVFLDANRLKANGFQADVHNAVIEGVSRHVMKTKPADVAPIVHAEWIPGELVNGITGAPRPAYYRCGRCGERFYETSKYCPECGALMESRRSG